MTVKRLAVLLTVLCAIVGASGVVEAAGSQDVSFKTDDGLTIAGSLYAASRPGPAVILLHMQTRTREDWHAVASRLADAGMTALAFDFRGHGASDPAAADGEPQDISRLHLDIKAAVAFLAARREVVPGRIGIAGASIGANLAMLYAANDDKVRSLALLSPGLDYRNLRPEAGLKKYGSRPALIVVSQEDNYATNSCRQFAGTGPGIGVRDLRVLNGAGHGTAMIAHQPDLVVTLVDWFRRTLL
jgi:alpha-beta hydrolase superfamily lysophospholipase